MDRGPVRELGKEMNEAPWKSTVVKYAVAQSLTEIALGSIIHTLRIPLGGHFLSLNQALLLTLATRHSRDERKRAVTSASQIANTVAVLKALSPSGKRLTPMLAISVQGFLFSLGIVVLGANLLGALLGSALLSIWGFAQPLLIAWLVFGKAFFGGVEKLWVEIARALSIPESHGIWILAACLAVKVLIAGGVSAFAWRSGRSFEERYLRELHRWSSKAPTRPARSPGTGALRELRNPWFVLAFSLSLLFFVATSHPSAIEIVGYLLRIGAGMIIVFWGVRALPKSWIERWLGPFPQFKAGVDQALRALLSRT